MAPRGSVPRMVHKRFAPLKPLLGRLPTDSKDSKTFRTDTEYRLFGCAAVMEMMGLAVRFRQCSRLQVVLLSCCDEPAVQAACRMPGTMAVRRI